MFRKDEGVREEKRCNYWFWHRFTLVSIPGIVTAQSRNDGIKKGNFWESVLCFTIWKAL